MFTLGLRLGEAPAVRRTDFNADFTEVHIQQAADYHTHEMSAPKRGQAPVARAAPPGERCRAQWETRGMTWRGCCARLKAAR